MLLLMVDPELWLVLEPIDGDESARRDEAWSMLQRLWNTSTFNSGGDRLTRDFMNAIDTNVLLYSIDRNEPAKQLKAQQLAAIAHRIRVRQFCSGRCWAN